MKSSKVARQLLPSLHGRGWGWVIFFLLSCQSGKENVYRYVGGEIRLEVVNDTLSILRHIPTSYSPPSMGGVGGESSFSLPYPTFRLSCGDLTGDGTPEIGVGVVKRTRFSPEKEKRLFIFHLTEGCLIRPLWMGSHVGARLDDFRFDDRHVCTTEHDADGNTFNRTYELTSFGLKPVTAL